MQRNLTLRNYGEPTNRRYEIAMDKLTDVIAAYRSTNTRNVIARVEKVMIDSLGPTADKYGHSHLVPAAREAIPPLWRLIESELPLCEPIYLAEEIVTILEVARESLPAVNLRRSDVLTDNGFVWLANPIPNFWGNFPLVAFGWVIDKDDTTIAAVGYHEFDGVLVPTPSPMRFPGSGKVEDYDFPIAKLLTSFWLLAQQRLLGINREDVSRAVRRRADREIKTVIVVTLRRKDYPETAGTRKVDWTHRWLTRGHWRNQFYPSQGRHKPIWIAGYVKGPEDRPFVAKGRAFEFNR